jgi:thymidine kinase
VAKLHFYYSTMNAGKSAMLLQSSYNYNESGMKTLLMFPHKGTRAGQSMIASRIGIEKFAVSFDEYFELFDYIKNETETEAIACVLIDEAQFLTKSQVFQLCAIVDELNIPILAYGLRTDFQGELFPGSKYLLGLADALVEIKAICHCGKKATMNMRIDKNGNPVRLGEQIEIGGNERYVPTCRKHFTLGVSKRQATKSVSVISEYS